MLELNAPQEESFLPDTLGAEWFAPVSLWPIGTRTRAIVRNVWEILHYAPVVEDYPQADTPGFFLPYTR
ncbi:MAG: hypothetical protein JWQ71_3738 [Pedosphaera sp.]|nr:hypothetical protein [Pedosphaera sp.]